ncbi:MAG: hypothetical protein ACYC8T_16820 [Myxococcaceae bacterium]
MNTETYDESPYAIAAFCNPLLPGPSDLAAHESPAPLLERDLSEARMSIEEHRARLRRLPTHAGSLHAVFRFWMKTNQNDKAYCAAGVLTFLGLANAAASAFYTEGCSRLAHETRVRLSPPDLEALVHPGARNPLVELLRAIGDQLTSLYPPQFALLGVDRKTDRLKPGNAIFNAVQSVAQIFGVEDFEVYQARRPRLDLETTEPLSICVGHDLIRKHNAREQKFLLGRAALGLLNKTAVLDKLSPTEAAELFGNSVRIHQPDYAGLGARNDDASKRLRKAYSYGAVKAIKVAALAIAQGKPRDLALTIEALGWSADRAGLIACGDVAIALGMLLRDDPNISDVGTAGATPGVGLLARRRDVLELLAFAVSDDCFRLRGKLGLAVG